jgi:hypothetical protein
MSVELLPGTTWAAGAPAKLFGGTFYLGGGEAFGRMYDVAPDGSRFLMIKEVSAGNDGAKPPSILIVQNWFEELRRLAPTG